jgi:predicted transposase YbfD/YdcC
MKNDQKRKKATDAKTIGEHFSSMTDPRIVNKSDHKLLDIITIIICAVICGADTFTEIEEYAIAKYDWFKNFLELPNGIPSHDTFGRVFSLLNPEEFQNCFQQWIKTIASVTSGEIVAIDGKTLRSSYDRANNKSAIHMVNAWASHNRLCIGQVKTDEKSNEITAIPKLLEMLELSGCIVTIDAMGCQKHIAGQIEEKGADYVLALKANHENLHEEVVSYFDEASQHDIKDYDIDTCETVDGGHGRVETRRCYVCSEIDWLTEKKLWKGLRSIVKVESERCIDNVTSNESRYYITSLKSNPKHILHAIRSHWGVENSLHWVLDVAFREDDSRTRKGHAAENFAIARTIATNLLKNEKTLKRGVKTRRLKAGWDNDYLLKVLSG